MLQGINFPLIILYSTSNPKELLQDLSHICSDLAIYPELRVDANSVVAANDDDPGV